MDFKKYLKEADKKEEEKTAVMAFGRFNPPTVGHEKLIHKVEDVASDHKGTAHIVASHSQGTAKDPLDQDTKLNYLHSIAKADTAVTGSSKASPTIFHAAAKLYKQGHKHLVVVAGSDRVNQYKQDLEKYNDGHQYPHGSYKFKSIKVVSAGQRDPDAEGVEGMSGTKMREHAKAGRIGQFRTGLPDVLKSHAEEISNKIRTVKENYEISMTNIINETPECVTGVWSESLSKCVSVREAYINNEIFKLNDLVEANNGDKGPIVYRGSTYVTIQLKEGKTVKHWLKNIQEANKVVPQVTIKPARKVLENKLPALFMSKEKFHEMANKGMELEYMGYETHNLHMCPGASEQLHELIKNTKLNPKYILQAVQASDKYLEIEKEAKAKGFANEKMVHDFNMYVAIAHDTLNMLGYPDHTLEYISKHIQDMGKLSMHPDGTFANETSSTVPTFGAGDTSESVKLQSRRIKETITMSKLRKKIAETYTPDPATAHRDVNLTGDKEVFHGIDKTIAGQGYEGKPLGLVSFKSFSATPETQSIEKDKTNAMADVHRAKAEISVHSSAVKLMRKAQQMDN